MIIVDYEAVKAHLEARNKANNDRWQSEQNYIAELRAAGFSETSGLMNAHKNKADHYAHRSFVYKEALQLLDAHIIGTGELSEEEEEE